MAWDPPGHASSYPFDLSFSLEEEAGWLREICRYEGIERPVLIGQSYGGYVGQTFASLYPSEIAGLISIDSAPLQKRYTTAAERHLLRHTARLYRLLPWRWLRSLTIKNGAVTAHGRHIMAEILSSYETAPERYGLLSEAGIRRLADAFEADRTEELPCPALLLCGTKDRAGSAGRYNKKWHRETGVPLVWIREAGHNANTDQPDAVNREIDLFCTEIECATSSGAPEPASACASGGIREGKR